MTEYSDFIASKRVFVPASPVRHAETSSLLFPFQREIVDWALARGRAAIFADTGLGKTLMELEWARHVAQHGRVLIFAPLAVAPQTVREGLRFGIGVRYALDQADAGDARIVITNYERLEHFDLRAFVGVVLDESSILKSFMGKTKRALVDRCSSVRWRLACTATPAPNDHLELGNHAEFLGVMTSHEMIARWFLPDTSTFGTYRLKGHGIEPFWDWVASWAVCIARPSDLGYDDAGYILPDLHRIPHTVEVDTSTDTGGELFRTPDLSATGLHKEKRRTVDARAAKVNELVRAEKHETWLVWCDTDYEADALLEVLPKKGTVEVRGSHTREKKERAALGFVDGRIRALVSKPSIFGWGLNFQHCARQAFVGTSYSYEAFYQAVRRSWRFGQKREVDAHVVMASTEVALWAVLNAKRDGHEEMRGQMSAAMRRARAKASPRAVYAPEREMEVPRWLRSVA